MDVCNLVASGVGTMAWSPLTLGLISEKIDNGLPVFTRQSFKVNFCPSNILAISISLNLLHLSEVFHISYIMQLKNLQSFGKYE